MTLNLIWWAEPTLGMIMFGVCKMLEHVAAQGRVLVPLRRIVVFPLIWHLVLLLVSALLVPIGLRQVSNSAAITRGRIMPQDR